MEPVIVYEHGHYAVYIGNELYCTADTHAEAKEEINELKEAL